MAVIGRPRLRNITRNREPTGVLTRTNTSVKTGSVIRARETKTIGINKILEKVEKGQPLKVKEQEVYDRYISNIERSQKHDERRVEAEIKKRQEQRKELSMNRYSSEPSNIRMKIGGRYSVNEATSHIMHDYERTPMHPKVRAKFEQLTLEQKIDFFIIKLKENQILQNI